MHMRVNASSCNGSVQAGVTSEFVSSDAGNLDTLIM